MSKTRPEQQAPPVQRVRIRYAKDGPLRFTSHRDFARALERALRRAGVPMAYSSGFHPHPRISYLSAASTGTASRAEYAELGLRAEVEPERLAAALDAALPPGLDVLDAVEAASSGFADRFEASLWRIELPELDRERAADAVAGFLGAEEVAASRLTKKGMRTFDVRAAVHSLKLCTAELEDKPGCAILELVVRQVTPAVRPDDVVSGMTRLAALELPAPPRVVRLAQGPLTESGGVADPFDADRERDRS